MAVDRGGLDYRIRVVDEFSAATEKFRAEIRASRNEFAGLRTDMAKSGAEAREAATGHRGAARAVDVRTEAERRLAREVRNVSVERQTQALADAQAIRRTREFVANQRLQNAATQAAVRFERERRTELDRQQRAETADARARKQRLAATERQADATRALTTQIRLQQQVEAAALAVSRERAALAGRQAAAEQADTAARQKRRSVEAALFAQQEQVRTASVAAAAAQKKAQVAANSNLGITQEQVAAQKQFTTATGQLVARTQQQNKALTQLNATGSKSGGIFQNLFFTFRRLIGVFAAFLIARQVVGGLVGAVREAVRFNAELEQARLGIAAVITAAGQVRDPLGQAATSARQFALAQVAAAEQTRKIRKDALATSATFEQLLQTFQVALGPGLAAGLNLDEVRQLTVRISQAATAIGLEQNQLAEEVRSILSGTIQLRTTRIAAVLGITNQDIKNARELGVLAEFLDTKFAAFAISGQASLQTFNVILSNLNDAISNLLAAGGEGLFNSLRALFQDLSGAIATVNQELGQVELNPKAVAVVEAFLDGLRAGVDGIRAVFGQLSFDDLLQSAEAAGTAIATAATVVAELVVLFLQAANTVAAVFNGIARIVRSIGGALGFLAALGPTLSIVAQLLTTFLAIRVVIGTIVVLFRSTFVAAVGRVIAAVLGLNAGLVAQLGLWRAITVAAAANPIGLALLAITTILGVVLGQMGVFSRLFGEVADSAGATEDAVADLRRQFAELDAQVSGALDTAGKFGENIRDLTEDLREATLAATFEQSVLGLTGGLRQQVDLFGSAQADFQKRALEINNSLEVSQQNLLGIQRRRARAETDLLDATTAVKAEVQIITDAQRDLLLVQGRQADAERELASAKLALDQARAEGDADAVSAAQARVAGLETEAAALEGAAVTAESFRDRTLATLTQLVATGQITQQQADALVANIKERISLEGQENSEAARIAALTEQRAELEAGVNAILAQRLTTQLAENLLALQEQNVELELQARQLQRIQDARRGVFGFESQATVLAAAQNAVDQENVELNQLKLVQERELADARRIAASAPDAITRALAEEQVTRLLANQNTELENQERVLAEVNRQLELRRFELEQPIEAGFTAAIEDFALKAADQFAFAVDLMSTTLNGFADLISSTIVDAFDPTKDLNIKERFARFLQEIATLILNHLAKLAIAKAALGLFGGASGGVGQAVNAALGFAEGGVVPNRPAPLAPPPGVSRKDTVNAWLQPGEPITPVDQARKYGYDFFEAIRRGAIDVGSVRALMGGLRLTGMRTRGSRGVGYADGGVASAARAANSLAAATAGGDNPIIAPTERAAARILAGGRRARRRAEVQDRRAVRGA
jgi:hypothetical protein